MMAGMTAREYKEWEAYERATGPLDSKYEREMMSQLHELIQLNNILTGASLTKRGKKNPAGKFRKVARPEHLTNPYLHLDEDEDPDDDDELEDEIYGSDEDYDEEEDSYESDPNAYDPAKDPFVNM